MLDTGLEVRLPDGLQGYVCAHHYGTNNFKQLKLNLPVNLKDVWEEACGGFLSASAKKSIGSQHSIFSPDFLQLKSQMWDMRNCGTEQS